MPRVTRFRIAAIGELHRQLAYAPAEARRRHMEAAETLVGEIRPAQVYPQDFIIFRITGYRSDQPETATAFVGEALVGDLATFIQRLSHGLQLSVAETERSPLTLAEAAGRLSVSTKTINRYRQQGLVCHYLVFPDGVQRLACFEDALDRFVAEHRDAVTRAGVFGRLDHSTTAAIVEEAAVIRGSRGLSLNATARVLANRHGRAHETIRQLLLRHDADAARPIFGEHGALTARDRRFIWRAARLGARVGALAERFGKGRPTIHRGLNRERRRRLAGLDLDTPPSIETEVLTHPEVVAGLPQRPVSIDALAWLDGVAAAGPPDPDLERTLTDGYNTLRGRVGAAIATLRESPGSAELDAIETDLRWAAAVKCRLLDLGLPPALRAMEQFLGRVLSSLASDEVLDGVRRILAVAADSADRIDPARGQRYSHVCGYAMTRALARGAAPPAGRAARRHETGSLILERPLERITAWQQWLDLRPDLRVRAATLTGRRRELVAARYGLTGERPLTLQAVATRHGGTVPAAARTISAALRELRGL